jgi:nuclear GTP-binding protein
MGKFSNRPTHNKSKRKSLKMKYKIDRKVKQHNRKIRKEANNMKSLGIYKKSISSF